MAGAKFASEGPADALFELLDDNQNGVLEMDEWKQKAHFLAQVSEDFNNNPEEAFAKMDVDNSNTISKDEFNAQIKALTEIVGFRKMDKALAAACRSIRGIK